jgi:hypothetical protein
VYTAARPSCRWRRHHLVVFFPLPDSLMNEGAPLYSVFFLRRTIHRHIFLGMMYRNKIAERTSKTKS